MRPLAPYHTRPDETTYRTLSDLGDVPHVTDKALSFFLSKKPSDIRRKNMVSNETPIRKETIMSNDKNINETPNETAEEAVEEPVKTNRFKSALNKIKPYAPHIATAVVSVVCGAIIFASLTEDENDEDDALDAEFEVLEEIEVEAPAED